MLEAPPAGHDSRRGTVAPATPLLASLFFAIVDMHLRRFRQRPSVGVAHLSSWSCQPAFGTGHPFWAARKSASASAFFLASVMPVAQTVMRMRPALNTKRRSVVCLPAVYPARK